MVPNWGWDKRGRACGGAAPIAGGCSGNAVCTPSPTMSFSRVCVLAAGDMTCPGGSYWKKHVFHQSATDTRDCSACGCDPPSGVTCNGGSVRIWDTNNCTASTTTAAIDGVCHFANGITTRSIAIDAGAPQGGSCAKKAGAGVPTGQVTPTNPTTLCCNQ